MFISCLRRNAQRLQFPYFIASLLAAALFAALFFPAAVQATGHESERTVRLEGIEGIFGITPTIGAVGDGRLTAQISREGTITCLRWPNATFYEHVKYRSGEYSPVRSENAWNQPYYGAATNAGMFAGIRYVIGATTYVRWLRDADDKSYAYAAETANRLIGTYTFADGLSVEESTFNVPEQPSLIRAYTVTALPDGASDVEIIYFANPALRTSFGGPYNPLPQVSEDGEARYGTFYLSADDAVLVALPQINSAAAREDVVDLVATNASAAEVAAFVDERQSGWTDGMFLAVGASVESSGVQVGMDRIVLGRSWGPQDAYYDATDGTLSNSNVAVTYETFAMTLPAALGTPVAVYASFASDAASARAALTEMRTEGVDTWTTESDQWWSDFLDGAIVPQASAQARAFGYRALISLRTGYDPESGAIVASTSCQPPYNLDWPRDGAFFQYVLDMNGWREEADKHARFYKDLNNEKRLYGPIGSFAMNYYADGTPGGPIDYEIDEIGLTLWLLRMHAAFEGEADPKAARAFLEDMWPTIKRSADHLTYECRDEEDPRLQCEANEDDNPPFVNTLHGAITVWLGLEASADIASALDHQDDADAYQARADGLDAAIRDHFHPQNGRGDAGVLGGALGWSVWPARFWNAEDGEALTIIRSRFTEELDRTILVDAEGTSYDTKRTLALLTDPVRNSETENYVGMVHDVYLNEIINQQTLHMGEGTVHDDFDNDGNREWRNITALPHIWAQTLLYLSLVAAEQPESLIEPADLKLSPKEAPTAGCSCAVTSGTSWPNAFLPLLVVLLPYLWRRRKL